MTPDLLEDQCGDIQQLVACAIGGGEGCRERELFEIDELDALMLSGDLWSLFLLEISPDQRTSWGGWTFKPCMLVVDLTLASARQQIDNFRADSEAWSRLT